MADLSFRLLAITPPVGPVDPAIVRAWRPADPVGLAVLLRDPGVPPQQLRTPGHRLTALRRACDRQGIPCLVSADRTKIGAFAALVKDLGLAGLQLRGDPTIADVNEARRRLAPGRWLGRSCHQEPAGMGDRVDYSVLAPIFPPRTPSVDAGPGKRSIGLAPLRALAAQEPHIFALGGITPARARPCAMAGAYGLAAIRTFFGPIDIVADNVARLALTWDEPTDDATPPTGR